MDNHGRAARGGQAQKRRLQLGKRQQVRRNVSADVVDRNERLVLRPCQRLGKVGADQQRADQTGCAGCRNRIHLGKLHTGLRERLLRDRADRVNMAAACNLRHHTAVKRVLLRLRINYVGTNDSSVLDNGRRRFITRGLNC